MQPIRDVVESRLKSGKVRRRRRGINCDCSSIAPTIMKRRQAEQSEVSADVKQQHARTGISDEVVELGDLLRVFVLEMIRAAVRRRVTNQRPARTHVKDFISPNSILDSVPSPLERFGRRTQPVANGTR